MIQNDRIHAACSSTVETTIDLITAVRLDTMRGQLYRPVRRRERATLSALAEAGLITEVSGPLGGYVCAEVDPALLGDGLTAPGGEA